MTRSTKTKLEILNYISYNWLMKLSIFIDDIIYEIEKKERDEFKEKFPDNNKNLLR